MKRAVLAALIVLGSSFAACADQDIYNDTTGRGRSDDLMRIDANYCSARLGAPKNGVPTMTRTPRIRLRWLMTVLLASS